MKATIIGGGIIGLSTALHLQEEGWEVTVLEKSDLKNNCSFGNMGYLSPSHLVPLAQPGIVSQGLLWMFNMKSPFYVRPSLNWSLIDWGLKFVRASNPEHVQRSAGPLTELLLLSRDLTKAWKTSGLMNFEYADDGCIMYYQTAKKEKEETEAAKMAQDLGLKIEIINREQAQQVEPLLRPDVRGGVWFKDDAHLHPNTLMRELQRVLELRGVRILRNAEVIGFDKSNGKINSVHYRHTQEQGRQSSETPLTNPYQATPATQQADIASISSELVVLAAGSWSRELANMAGEYIPLMPGKGYSMTIDVAEQKLKVPCILLESKVALTPWATRLRIGSTMEIGAINDKILFPRVRGILEAVPRFFPGYADDADFQRLSDFDQLRAEAKERIWFGFRPLSADGVPYIGFAKNHKNLIIATGHAMLGLSMGAATGKLCAELANGKPTSIGVTAFDPNRYA